MSKKRYLAAFGAAGLVFAGVYGAAASLDVDGGLAQAGSDSTLECDGTGVKVLGYLVDTTGYADARSSGVKVTNIDGDCFGKTLVARTLDGQGNELGYGFIENFSGKTQSVRYSNVPDGGVRLAEIEEVQITIG